MGIVESCECGTDSTKKENPETPQKLRSAGPEVAPKKENPETPQKVRSAGPEAALTEKERLAAAPWLHVTLEVSGESFKADVKGPETVRPTIARALDVGAGSIEVARLGDSEIVLDANWTTAGVEGGTTILVVVTGWAEMRRLQRYRAMRICQKLEYEASPALAVLGDGVTLAAAQLMRKGITLWNTAESPAPPRIFGVFQEDEIQVTSMSVGIAGRDSACVKALAVLGDGVTLASGSDDNKVRLWNTATGDCVRTYEIAFEILQMRAGRNYRQVPKDFDLKGHFAPVTALAVLGDGITLASAGEDGSIKLWNTATAEPEDALHRLCKDAARALEVLGDGVTLAAGYDHAFIKLWDTATGDCVRTLEGHTEGIVSLAVLGDGVTLVAGLSKTYAWKGEASADSCTIKLWNTATGDCVHTLKGHSDSVNALAVLGDGVTLASGSDDSAINLWNTATGACLHTVEAPAINRDNERKVIVYLLKGAFEFINSKTSISYAKMLF